MTQNRFGYKEPNFEVVLSRKEDIVFRIGTMGTAS